MLGGYQGKILKVDLSNGKIEGEDLPDDKTLRKYIGGWGLGLKYLYDLVKPGCAASDPENALIFMTGPLTGLPLPGATNITIATKNFDTGFTAGRAHSHGSFGILLKASGYDGIIISGKSAEPVFLSINDSKAELRDASHLWGKLDSHETEDAIKQELGNPGISVAAIGPAGENLCAGAMVCNDKNHSFSHSGVGAVMGSKKLKAIAVFGENPVPIVDRDKITTLNKEWIKHMRLPSHFGWRNRLQNSKKTEYRHMAKFRGFVGKNFRINQLTDFGLGMSEQGITSRPCPRCPIACPYDVKIINGPFTGYTATLSGGGENLEGAGSIFGITEAGTIFYLADLYDRLGIEASVAGCTIAMAIEAYEKGLICKKDTDGLELKWGDRELVETLVKKMVYREGFGDILARGTKEAAETIGGDAPSFAVNIKGGGMSLHDWRSVWGVLFGQIVSSGAGWAAPGADCFTPEPDAGYTELAERFDHRGKPNEVKRTGEIKFLNDSSGLCMFITWGIQEGLKLLAESFNAAAGWDCTPEELREVGGRIMHLERAFNVRHGLRPEDDWNIPERITEAPQDGPAKGVAIKPYLKGMVEEYYRLMGWDNKTGKPWLATLKKAGLDDIIEELWAQS